MSVSAITVQVLSIMPVHVHHSPLASQIQAPNRVLGLLCIPPPELLSLMLDLKVEHIEPPLLKISAVSS